MMSTIIIKQGTKRPGLACTRDQFTYFQFHPTVQQSVRFICVMIRGEMLSKRQFPGFEVGCGDVLAEKVGVGELGVKWG